jgi:hypothetical protein
MYINIDEIISITEAAVRVADQNEGQIKFEEFSHILEQLGTDIHVYVCICILKHICMYLPYIICV